MAGGPPFASSLSNAAALNDVGSGRWPCGRTRHTGVERGGQPHDLLLFGEVGVEVGQSLVGRFDGRADPGLLEIHGGYVDGTAVVGVGQLGPFALGLGQRAGERLRWAASDARGSSISAAISCGTARPRTREVG